MLRTDVLWMLSSRPASSWKTRFTNVGRKKNWYFFCFLSLCVFIAKSKRLVIIDYIQKACPRVQAFLIPGNELMQFCNVVFKDSFLHPASSTNQVYRCVLFCPCTASPWLGSGCTREGKWGKSRGQKEMQEWLEVGQHYKMDSKDCTVCAVTQVDHGGVYTTSASYRHVHRRHQ